MRLEYYPKTDAFGLWVDRREQGKIQALMSDHGMQHSITGSTETAALLVTNEPYCALSFFDYTTQRAKLALQPYWNQLQASWKTESRAHIRVPADKQLEPFQKAGVEYVLSRKHALVGDQPGLGKTMQAICVANELRAKRVLVICPANIRHQWQRRIREWSTMRWPFHVHVILETKRGVNATAAWTVVSYDLASTPAIGAALAAHHYDLCILDEAHYLKTIDARRTRAVFGGGEGRTFEPLASRAAHTLALTGTPLPNRPREAFTLARGLCYDAIDWLSFDRFQHRFNPSAEIEKNGKRFVIEKAGRLHELQNRLRVNFMVRREKHGPRGVMHQMHLPQYDLIRVEETGPVKAALKAEKLLDIDPETLAGADAAILGQIATVRRLMGVAMAPQVADWVQMLFDGGEEKIVLFYWHREVAQILMSRLSKFDPVNIDGETSAKQKEQRVLRFINDPTCQLIMGNLSSMGIGTDGLQEVSNHCLLAEPDWVPGVNQQAIDRLDRGGQRRQVQADIFVAEGSFAERVLASALRKGKVLHKTLDEREQVL